MLGLCASTALVWVVIEVLVMLLSLYLLTVHTDLSTFDLIAYSGYKYVGYVFYLFFYFWSLWKFNVKSQFAYLKWNLFFRMIFTVLCGLFFGNDGYYVALAWSSCALMFFIVSTGMCMFLILKWYMDYSAYMLVCVSVCGAKRFIYVKMFTSRKVIYKGKIWLAVICLSVHKCARQ